MKLLPSIVCIAAAVNKLRSLLSEAQTWELTVMIEDKSRHGIWRTYFAGKRGELFHRRYVVLGGLVDA